MGEQFVRMIVKIMCKEHNISDVEKNVKMVNNELSTLFKELDNIKSYLNNYNIHSPKREYSPAIKDKEETDDEKSEKTEESDDESLIDDKEESSDDEKEKENKESKDESEDEKEEKTLEKDIIKIIPGEPFSEPNITLVNIDSDTLKSTLKNVMAFKDDLTELEILYQQESRHFVNSDYLVNMPSKFSTPIESDDDSCDSDIENIHSPKDKEKIDLKILPNHRKIVLEWVSEVCMKCMLRSETYFLSIAILDKFLETISDKCFCIKSKLQLFASAALFIASKCEETYPLPCDDLVVLSDKDFSKRELINAEKLIISTLKGDFYFPTVKTFNCRFLDKFKSIYSCNDELFTRTKCLVNYISEISSLKADTLLFKPSIRSISAIYLARRMEDNEFPWDYKFESFLKELNIIVDNDIKDIVKECVIWFSKLVKCIQELQDKKPAIFLKFKAPSFNRVASIPLPNVLFE
jgi:hypothetical protein